MGTPRFTSSARADWTLEAVRSSSSGEKTLVLVSAASLSGRFLDPGQVAAGDDNLAVAIGGEHAGCRITEPGGGAGDERERMFHGVSVVKGEGRERPREVRAAL